jgi:hypothetical protein
MHTNHELFENYDEADYTKIHFDTTTFGFVVAHKLHGENEIKGNQAIALLLTKHGYRVVLLGNQPNIVSADATLDDEVWEFKTISDAQNLSNRVQRDIHRGKRQAANILIFIAQFYRIKEITKGIYNAIKFDEKRMVNKVSILFQNGDLIKLTREEMVNSEFILKFPIDI